MKLDVHAATVNLPDASRADDLETEGGSIEISFMICNWNGARHRSNLGPHAQLSHMHDDAQDRAAA